MLRALRWDDAGVSLGGWSSVRGCAPAEKTRPMFVLTEACQIYTEAREAPATAPDASEATEMRTAPNPLEREFTFLGPPSSLALAATPKHQPSDGMPNFGDGAADRKAWTSHQEKDAPPGAPWLVGSQ